MLNTLVYMLGLHFALPVQEHKNLRVDSKIKVCYNETLKLKYLLYTENASKNNQGGLQSLHYKPKQVCAYQNTANPERCIVTLYEEYIQRRPYLDAKCSVSLYLRPLSSPKTHVWFSCQALGVNTLQKIVKQMAEKVGIAGNFSNHSLRATLATKNCRDHRS